MVRIIVGAIQSGSLSIGRRIRCLLFGLIVIGIIFACGGIMVASGNQRAARVKAAVQDTLPFYAEYCNDVIAFPAGWPLGLILPFPARRWEGMCTDASDSFFSVNLSTCEVTTIHFQGNTTYQLAWCP